MSLERLDQLYGPVAGAHFRRELEFVRGRVLEAKIPAQNGTLFIPQVADVEVWADSYVHRMIEFIGQAQFISDYADDLPLVDLSAREDVYKIKTIGVAYQFSRKEIQRSAASATSLSNSKAQAARTAIEQKLNRIQWYGDPSAGLFGFLNFPYIPRYLANETFDGSTTPSDALAELNAIANVPGLLTDTVADPDTMLVAPEIYNYIATTPLGSGSDTTILAHFLNNNPQIREVVNTRELRGAGPNGENLIVAYRRSQDNIQHTLVEPFTQLAPQEKNLAVITNCVAQTGGVVSDYPRELVIAEIPLA